MIDTLDVLIWDNKIQFAHIINEIADNEQNIIQTLSDYEKKILYFSGKEDSDDKRNKIKGDMFEVLSAIFFDRMGDSPRVGINRYRPISLENDYGVDAIGINVAGSHVAIQVKFRSDPRSLIHYSDIAKTYTYSVIKKWVLPENTHSIYLFTNAKGVTTACETVFGQRLVVINRDIIKEYLDNNKRFWINFINKIYKVLKNGDK